MDRDAMLWNIARKMGSADMTGAPVQIAHNRHRIMQRDRGGSWRYLVMTAEGIVVNKTDWHPTRQEALCAPLVMDEHNEGSNER